MSKRRKRSKKDPNLKMIQKPRKKTRRKSLRSRLWKRGKRLCRKVQLAIKVKTRMRYLMSIERESKRKEKIKIRGNCRKN
jgi:hypothetical protein